MAAYNGNEWIHEQVKSILSQKFVEVSILISDDLSVDKTTSIIENYSENDDRVSLVKQNRGSGSAGQNFMKMIRDVDVSNCEYIAFSDQDDIWFSDKITRAISKIESSISVAYSSSVLAFWPSGKKKILHQSPEVKSADFLFEGAGQGCTFVLTVDFFLRVQKFCIDNKSLTDIFYYHDWLVYLLSRCWGQKWFFDNRPSMNYRQHDGNDTGARSGFSSFKRRINLIANGWYKKQIEVAIEIAKKADSDNESIKKLECLLGMKKSLIQRVRLVSFVAKSGRRKFIDRVVLVLSVLFFWI